MRKVFCDACQQIIPRRVNVLSVYCRLVEGPGYGADRQGDPILGRPIEFDLCNKCYNRVAGAVVERLKSIQVSLEPKETPDE